MIFTNSFTWPEAFLHDTCRIKNYFLSVNLLNEHSWILPANFFVQCHEWTILSESTGFRLYLTTVTGSNICLQKRMNMAEKNQFEKVWLAFQSSVNETFDLRGFEHLA